MQKFLTKLKAATEVVESMKTNPEDWEVDGFRAVNQKTQSEIWYANKEYGLGFVHNGVYYTHGRKAASSKYIASNVTFISALFGNLIPWRRKLIKACTNHIGKHGTSHYYVFPIYSC
jgi:hypothetical protein